MTPEIAHIADLGRKRSDQTDFCFSLPALRIQGLVDGHGWMFQGAPAGQLIIDSLHKVLGGVPVERLPGLAELCPLIRQGLELADFRLKQEATFLGQDPKACSYLLLVLNPQNPAEAICLHAGACRLYRYRAGQLEVLGRDHIDAWVEPFESHLRGEIPEPAPPPRLVRCLGRDPDLGVEEIRLDVQPEDLLLLCSDGLTRMFPDHLIARVLYRRRNKSLEAVASSLIDEANAAGGDDNVSVFLVEPAGAIRANSAAAEEVPAACAWVAAPAAVEPIRQERPAGASPPTIALPPSHPQAPARSGESARRLGRPVPFAILTFMIGFTAWMLWDRSRVSPTVSPVSERGESGSVTSRLASVDQPVEPLLFPAAPPGETRTRVSASAREQETKPVETKPVETKPVETKPVETKPVETKPVETKPVETKPVETKPVETKPVETKPVETKPVETKPVETKPVETKPVETKPVETKPVETKPVETKPVETKPVETKPVETKPVETKPVETKPVETKPVETKPVETKPVETKPVETKPVETKPVETKPVETKPVETKPVETKPVETKPVETKPVETKPVETKPVETKPVETKPVETKPVETKPVETKPVETKPVETKPVETKPVETKPVETKPVETKPVETKPVETKPVETKPTVDNAKKSNPVLPGFAGIATNPAAVEVPPIKRDAPPVTPIGSPSNAAVSLAPPDPNQSSYRGDLPRELTPPETVVAEYERLMVRYGMIPPRDPQLQTAARRSAQAIPAAAFTIEEKRRGLAEARRIERLLEQNRALDGVRRRNLKLLRDRLSQP